MGIEEITQTNSKSIGMLNGIIENMQKQMSLCQTVLATSGLQTAISVSSDMQKALSLYSKDIEHLTTMINGSSFKIISENAMNTLRVFTNISKSYNAMMNSVQIPRIEGIKFLEKMTIVQKNLMNTSILLEYPSDKFTRFSEPPKEDIDKLDQLLYALDPILVEKRKGAWMAFNSDNPDNLSHATDSMVEVLKHVLTDISKKHTSLRNYIRSRYNSKSLPKFTEMGDDWVESTAKFIEETKGRLEGIKHHIMYEYSNVVEGLLHTTEGLLLIILG